MFKNLANREQQHIDTINKLYNRVELNNNKTWRDLGESAKHSWSNCR